MINFSLYSKYQKELYGRETITHENYGFMTYKVYDDNSIYIHGLYIDPQYRRFNVSGELEKQVIEKHNPTVIYCYVDMTTLHPEQSLGCIMKNGYNIVECDSTKIVLRKEIV